jgi:hypothetical protein
MSYVVFLDYNMPYIDDYGFKVRPTDWQLSLEQVDWARNLIGQGDITTSERYNRLERVQAWANDMANEGGDFGFGSGHRWDQAAEAKFGKYDISLQSDKDKQKFMVLTRNLTKILEEIKTKNGDFVTFGDNYFLYSPNSGIIGVIGGDNNHATAFNVAEALARRIVEFANFYDVNN